MKKSTAIATDITLMPENVANLLKKLDTVLKDIEGIKGALISTQQVAKLKKDVLTVEQPEKKAVDKSAAAKKAWETKRAKKAAADNTVPTASNAITKSATVAEAPWVRTTHHRTPSSVRLTPHEITLNIGSFPVKELAENDAKDFLNNPKIFWYRGLQFPDPKRYSVQSRVETARVVKRSDPKFNRAPWTVSVTIALSGDDKKCDSWGTGVYTKNKADQE